MAYGDRLELRLVSANAAQRIRVQLKLTRHDQ